MVEAPSLSYRANISKWLVFADVTLYNIAATYFSVISSTKILDFSLEKIVRRQLVESMFSPVPTKTFLKHACLLTIVEKRLLEDNIYI